MQPSGALICFEARADQRLRTVLTTLLPPELTRGTIVTLGSVSVPDTSTRVGLKKTARCGIACTRGPSFSIPIL